MENSAEKETFYKANGPDGEEYVCPMSRRGEIRPNSEECVEADVVGRYAGNLEIVSR